MFGRALRLDDHSLRFLIVGIGLCWADGIPRYLTLLSARALWRRRDVFVCCRGPGCLAFHWHNISGRTSVFLLILLPAEALVLITGNLWAGIIAYGLLFYILLDGAGHDLRDRPLTRPGSFLSMRAGRQPCSVHWSSAFPPRCGSPTRYSGPRWR